MKNLLSNPKTLLFISIFFFVIGSVDSYIHDASSYGDLGIVGKVSVVLCMIPFAFLFVKYFILPIGNAIIKWFM